MGPANDKHQAKIGLGPLMALAAAHSKVVVRLLFVHCVLLLSLFVGVWYIGSLFYFAVYCGLSGFASSPRGRVSWLLHLFVSFFLFRVSYRWCPSLALPCITMGWSVVCDCGISWSYRSCQYI